MILYYDCALLKRRVRGIDRIAHQLFVPLPIGPAGPGELGACQPGCVETYEPTSFNNKLLNRVLLLCGELEGSLVQLYEYLVSGQVVVCQCGEITGEVDVEVVFGGKLLEERSGGFYH